MPALKYVLILLSAYLLGGIPFSYLAGRLVKGVDLRRKGSGNLGATNAGRVLGWPWGVLVFGLDFAKGWLAVALAQWLLGPGLAPVLAGLAAILGHSFTPYLRFKGGKSVAASTGAFVRLAPLATGFALLAFLLILLLARMVSAASVGAALILPLAIIWLRTGEWALIVFSLLVGLLICIRHRSNLQRILSGTEPRIRFSREGGD